MAFPTRNLKRWIPYGIAIVIAVALKWHYSTASADELRWILSPTASVVASVSSLDFEKDDRGYTDWASGVSIEKPCAGVNFLIISFCMLFFTGIRRHGAAVVLPGSLLGACAATLVANSTRIVLAAGTFRADLHAGWLTPGRVHRIEGIAVYFTLLCLLYGALQLAGRHVPAAKSPRERGIAASLAVPWLWYLSLTIFLPAALSAVHSGSRTLVEHGIFVLVVSLGVVLAAWSLLRGLGALLGSEPARQGSPPSAASRAPS